MKAAVVVAVILLLLLVQSAIAFNLVAADQGNPKLNRSVSTASIAISPPTDPQMRNATLEPYNEWQEWRWWASWFLALDLPPHQNVTAPFLSSRCGDCVPVPDGTNCSGHCSPFLSAGIPNEGQYYYDTQLENQTSITPAEVIPLLLGLPAQLRQTSLGFYILDQGAWSQNGTFTPDSPEVVLGGHLRVFLNETPILANGKEDMVFYPPWYDTGSTTTFPGILDLTSSTLRFVWFGSATIHVVVRVDYTLDCREHAAVAFKGNSISLEGVSLYRSTPATYPNPYLSAMIFVNASAPLSSLHLIINGTDEGTTTYSNNTMTNYATWFKAMPSNPAMPIIAGKTYTITLIATFEDNSTFTASVSVVALAGSQAPGQTSASTYSPSITTSVTAASVPFLDFPAVVIAIVLGFFLLTKLRRRRI